MAINKEDMDVLVAKAKAIAVESVEPLKTSMEDLSSFSFSLCDGSDIDATNSLNEDFFNGLKEGKDLKGEFASVYDYKSVSDI